MTKKTFASFEQQIQHLEDKVIIISDRAYAEAMLKQIGYFPLIGGYKHLFRVPFTKTYKIGTTFEEIVALYEFDSDLRDLFFKYLLQIERNLRSLMSYYFTEKYGESQDAYLDSSNYNTNRRNQKVVARLISTLNTRLKSDTLDFAFSFAEYTASNGTSSHRTSHTARNTALAIRCSIRLALCRINRYGLRKILRSSLHR